MVAVRTELPAGVITLLLLKGGSTPSPLTAASSREAWAIKPTTFVDGGIDFRRVEAATGFSSRQADLRLVPQDTVFVLFFLEAANVLGQGAQAGIVGVVPLDVGRDTPVVHGLGLPHQVVVVTGLCCHEGDKPSVEDGGWVCARDAGLGEEVVDVDLVVETAHCAGDEPMR
jgi:hypothetical protein